MEISPNQMLKQETGINIAHDSTQQQPPESQEIRHQCVVFILNYKFAYVAEFTTRKWHVWKVN
jgi:hypothetical protein